MVSDAIGPTMIEGALMIGGGIAAGLFGSLLGLGGGILIVPLLTLGFGLPLLTWTVRSEADRKRASFWASQMIFEGFRP